MRAQSQLSCLLAFTTLLVYYTEGYPIRMGHPTFSGDASEPNVVMQSVVVGKKPKYSGMDNCDPCAGCNYQHMRNIFKSLVDTLQTPTYRYKREGINRSEGETGNENVMERLMEAIEEIKQEGTDADELVEGNDFPKRERLEHLIRSEDDEELPFKGRKKEGYRANDEEYHPDKTLRRFKKSHYKKKESELSDSWPRRVSDDHLYFPIQYQHHQPPHQRVSGEFVP